MALNLEAVVLLSNKDYSNLQQLKEILEFKQPKSPKLKVSSVITHFDELQNVARNAGKRFKVV